MSRTFTLCADDFAQSDAIGEAILTLCAAGRLSATSVFSQAPAWRSLAPQLAAVPGIDVGLHFNLTHPLGDIARPLGDIARPLPYWLVASQLRRLSVPALSATLRRQLDAFADAYGALPDFIDGHQHVHALPQVRDALFATLAEYAFPGGRPYLRAPDRLGHPGESRAKAAILRQACRGFAARARALGYRVPDWFGGLYSLSPDADYPALMRQWLAAGPDGALLMCHPGLGDAAGDPIAAARRREFDYLAGERFAEDCARAGVTLGRYRAA